MNLTDKVIVALTIIYLIFFLIIMLVSRFLSFKTEHIGNKKTFISNRDWLATLSNHDLTTLMLGGLADFSKQSTQSQDFLENWLDAEYNEELVKIYFPYLDCFRDKSVNIF